MAVSRREHEQLGEMCEMLEERAASAEAEVKRLRERLASYEGALDWLLSDFSRMPDARLTADDPRYAWWYQTAESRKHARELQRSAIKTTR